MIFKKNSIVARRPLVQSVRFGARLALLAAFARLLPGADIVTFPTKERIILTKNGGGTILTAELTDEDRARYSGPLERDPAGNWGANTEGIQMSARFRSPVAVAGEPVQLFILIRNTSESDIEFGISRPPEQEFGLQVFDSNGAVVSPRRPVPSGSDFQKRLSQVVNNPKSLRVRPRSQTEIVVPLHELFDLDRSSRYFVSARDSIRRSDGSWSGEVASGTATVVTVSKDFQNTNSVAIPLPDGPPNARLTTEIAVGRSEMAVTSGLQQPSSRSHDSPDAIDVPTRAGTGEKTERRSYFSIALVVVALLGLVAFEWLRRRRTGGSTREQR